MFLFGPEPDLLRTIILQFRSIRAMGPNETSLGSRSSFLVE